MFRGVLPDDHKRPPETLRESEYQSDAGPQFMHSDHGQVIALVAATANEPRSISTPLDHHRHNRDAERNRRTTLLPVIDHNVARCGWCRDVSAIRREPGSSGFEPI